MVLTRIPAATTTTIIITITTTTTITPPYTCLISPYLKSHPRQHVHKPTPILNTNQYLSSSECT